MIEDFYPLCLQVKTVHEICYKFKVLYQVILFPNFVVFVPKTKYHSLKLYIVCPTDYCLYKVLTTAQNPFPFVSFSRQKKKIFKFWVTFYAYILKSQQLNCHIHCVNFNYQTNLFYKECNIPLILWKQQRLNTIEHMVIFFMYTPISCLFWYKWKNIENRIYKNENLRSGNLKKKYIPNTKYTISFGFIIIAFIYISLLKCDLQSFV